MDGIMWEEQERNHQKADRVKTLEEEMVSLRKKVEELEEFIREKQVQELMTAPSNSNHSNFLQFLSVIAHEQRRDAED